MELFLKIPFVYLIKKVLYTKKIKYCHKSGVNKKLNVVTIYIMTVHC